MRVARLTSTFLLLAACSEKPTAGVPDGSEGDGPPSTADGGTGSDDSGQTVDLGLGDANPAGDAVASDTGDEPRDSGVVTQPDATQPTADGGFVFPDAGSGPGLVGSLCVRNADCSGVLLCSAVNAGGALELSCQNPNVGGLDLGSPCLSAAGCLSNLCIQQRFGQQCSRPCTGNSECGVGYECRSETISVLGAPPAAVNVCMATAQPCQVADDCPPGAACAFAPNGANNGLERVCATFGGSGGGVTCSSPDDCRSRSCVFGTCAEPCRSTTDCFGFQVCQAEQVSVGGLSGTFDVCTTFPDQICSSSSDCSNGARVCGELRTNASVVPYCIAPNPSGLARGEHCATDAACREQICHFMSEECSVVCGQDSDCGAGYVCNHVTYNPGNSRIGLCVRTCSDDQDCRVAGSPGNVCSPNSNALTGQTQLICTTPVGASPLGAPCTDGSQCQSGFCFTSDSYFGSCTSAAQCGGVPCEGGQCHAHYERCTAVCDNNADCAGGGPFTSCQPINVGGSNVNLCALPPT
ncbi:MAG: hypothetical protein HY791_35460 [Deltaproteobacteria bacterium]|nr:hypothetical protein [Deltaproteobacteria bacterium]